MMRRIFTQHFLANNDELNEIERVKQKGRASGHAIGGAVMAFLSTFVIATVIKLLKLLIIILL